MIAERGDLDSGMFPAMGKRGISQPANHNLGDQEIRWRDTPILLGALVIMEAGYQVDKIGRTVERMAESENVPIRILGISTKLIHAVAMGTAQRLQDALAEKE